MRSFVSDGHQFYELLPQDAISITKKKERKRKKSSGQTWTWKHSSFVVAWVIFTRLLKAYLKNDLKKLMTLFEEGVRKAKNFVIKSISVLNPKENILDALMTLPSKVFTNMQSFVRMLQEAIVRSFKTLQGLAIDVGNLTMVIIGGIKMFVQMVVRITSTALRSVATYLKIDPLLFTEERIGSLTAEQLDKLERFGTSDITRPDLLGDDEFPTLEEWVQAGQQMPLNENEQIAADYFTQQRLSPAPYVMTNETHNALKQLDAEEHLNAEFRALNEYRNVMHAKGQKIPYSLKGQNLNQTKVF